MCEGWGAGQGEGSGCEGMGCREWSQGDGGGQGMPHPDKLHEGVVDVGAAGQEEAAARAELVEEEELLILQQRGRYWGDPRGCEGSPQALAGLTFPIRR